MMKTRRNGLVAWTWAGALLVASCGGGSDGPGTTTATGGVSGDGDGDLGDGDGDGDGDLGDGDGDGDGGTGGTVDGVGGDAPAGGNSSGGGGANPVGGAPSTGGETALGGDGTGGNEGTVTTATLGDPCDSPGAFACAESNSKLALICGGQGEWEYRETCAGEAVCDSYEGSGLGTCRVPLPECEIVTGAFCGDDGGQVVECAESGLELLVVEECATGYGCVNGLCAPVADECPAQALYTTICSDDCETKSPDNYCLGNDECDNTHTAVNLSEDTPAIFRLPSTGLCPFMCSRNLYTLNIHSVPDFAVRVSLGPGWEIITAGCDAPDSSGCVVLPPIPEGEYEYWQVWMAPDSENPVSRNVLVEAVPPGTTCD